jgi:hypothetical protein
MRVGRMEEEACSKQWHKAGVQRPDGVYLPTCKSEV